MSFCCGPSAPDTRPTSRRQFLRHAGGGVGLLALASVLTRDGLRAAAAPSAARTASAALSNPFAPKSPHFPAKAQRVIFLFMSGGPSHVDLFDPKPDLIRLAGQPIPESFGTFKTRRAVAKNKLLAPLRPFKRCGESGMEVSDWLPNIATCVDDICLLPSCWAD